MTTTTQGEHAHTALEDFEVRKLAAIGAVSTSSGLVERRPIEYRRELENQFVRGYRAAEIRLHAQVAALTAAPSVSDGQRALHEAILNRLSHAELLEKAHYLMELNSNQARTIGELQDLVEAAPAQPAAPQGVAYAELRKEFDLWWNDQMGNEPGRDTSSDSRAFMPYKAWKEATNRASHGQAPAGAALFDEQGFRDWVLRNLPDDTIIGNGAWWAEHLTAWAKRFIKATPTAQAAPAADLQPNFAQLRKALADRRFRGEMDLQDLVNMAANIITEDGDVISGQRGIIDKLKTAPAAGAVAVPRAVYDALLAWRNPQGDSLATVRPLLKAIDDMLAAPTPAAQADSVLEDAERKTIRDEGFNAGTVAALAVIRAHDMETVWVDVLRAAGADSVLRHAALVEPDDWHWGGFGEYAKRNGFKRPSAARKQGAKHD